MYKWYNLFDYWVYILFILHLIFPKHFISPIFLYVLVLIHDLEILININRKYEIVQENNLRINKVIVAHRLFLFIFTHLIPFMYLFNNYTFSKEMVIYSIIVLGIYLLYTKINNIDFSNYELENIKLNNNTFEEYIKIRYMNGIMFSMLFIFTIYIGYITIDNENFLK